MKGQISSSASILQLQNFNMQIMLCLKHEHINHLRYFVAALIVLISKEGLLDEGDAAVNVLWHSSYKHLFRHVLNYFIILSLFQLYSEMNSNWGYFCKVQNCKLLKSHLPEIVALLLTRGLHTVNPCFTNGMQLHLEYLESTIYYRKEPSIYPTPAIIRIH